MASESPIPLRNERQLLTECVYKEARGEGDLGMEAVANVLKNRTKAWNQSITKVVCGKNQFSCMSVPTDPQFGKPCPYPEDKDGVLWAKAGAIIERVFGEMAPDPTLGALYYANLATMDRGGWFARNIVGKPSLHPLTVTLGKHSFYK